MGLLVVHPDLGHVGGQVVAYGPCGQAQFLVYDGRGLFLLGVRPDVGPQPVQVLVVAFQGRLGLAHGSGSGDEAHTLGGLEGFEHLLEPDPLLLVFDLAGNPHLGAAHGVDEAASGQGEIGRQERAFLARGLLDHLDQDLLAGLEHLLHERVALALFGGRAADVVFRVDLVDLEEPVALGPVIDERGLEPVVDVVDVALVDVALGLGLVHHLDVVLVNLAFLGDDDLYLFSRQHGDEHLLPFLFCCHANLWTRKKLSESMASPYPAPSSRTCPEPW